MHTRRNPFLQYKRPAARLLLLALLTASGHVLAEPPPPPPPQDGQRPGIPPGLDRNSDQRVDRQEFSEDIDRRYADADSNKDGLIDAEELHSAKQRRMERERNEREQRRFSRLDGNGDGVIDSTEFDAEAWKHFQAMDRDGDDAIDATEWHPPGPPPPGHMPGRRARPQR